MVVNDSVKMVDIVEILTEFHNQVKNGKTGLLTSDLKFPKPGLLGINFWVANVLTGLSAAEIIHTSGKTLKIIRKTAIIQRITTPNFLLKDCD